MKNKYDTAWFINKAKLKHNDKYDYSLVDYKNSKGVVTIICKVHGKYDQVACYHLAGNGCPSCSGNIKSTTQNFINSCLEKYGDQKYDYSLSKYISSKKQVTIRCIEHDYIFKQIPSYHLKGTAGCKFCKKSYSDFESFLVLANKKHHNKYTYIKDSFKTSQVAMEIVCPVHGTFQQSPNTHLSGSGCQLCGRTTTAKKKTYNSDKFIEKANKVHNNKFTYDKLIYTNARATVTITCSVHGDFEQIAANHLRGYGCKPCAESTFVSKAEKDLVLYLQSLELDVIQSYRPPWMGRLELDIYVPSLNLAIEYNGSVYHHSDNETKSEFYKTTYKAPEYHLNKFNICLENNVNMIHIFDFEDIEVWKEQILKYKNNPDKYYISFKNNLRSGFSGLLCYGESFILENNAA